MLLLLPMLLSHPSMKSIAALLRLHRLHPASVSSHVARTASNHATLTWNLGSHHRQSGTGYHGLMASQVFFLSLHTRQWQYGNGSTRSVSFFCTGPGFELGGRIAAISRAFERLLTLRALELYIVTQTILKKREVEDMGDMRILPVPYPNDSSDIARTEKRACPKTPIPNPQAKTTAATTEIQAILTVPAGPTTPEHQRSHPAANHCQVNRQPDSLTITGAYRMQVKPAARRLLC
jgi:hypothetical protein